MTKSQKLELDDLHLVLLSGASQREEGNVLPFPDSVRTDRPTLEPAVAALMQAGLIEEVPGVPPAQTWREEHGTRIGLKIAEAGLELIDEGMPASEGRDAASEPEAARPGRAGSKQTLLLDLLSREGGATMDELVEATGWLPHSTRAAITGLRKRGHNVSNARRDGVSRYALEQAAR